MILNTYQVTRHYIRDDGWWRKRRGRSYTSDILQGIKILHRNRANTYGGDDDMLYPSHYVDILPTMGRNVLRAVIEGHNGGGLLHV